MLTYGVLFAPGNAILISPVAIAIRRMSLSESTETLTLYQMSIRCGALGFAIWSDVPTPAVLTGTAIVVASGLYILWRETLRRDSRESAPSRE
jgi:hypothetical protein